MERLRRVVEAAKRVNPRSAGGVSPDGKIDEIIPDLIDIGIDAKPLQPEVMDITAIKREYGRHLALGRRAPRPPCLLAAAEVRQAVRDLIRTVGEGGGLLVAPTHLVEPEVPWENILAFIEAVEEYGAYA